MLMVYYVKSKKQNLKGLFFEYPKPQKIKIMKHNWYIICTKTNQEKKVLTRLTRQGIECYCPFANKPITTGTQTAVAYMPVFSSYVFAYISTTQIQQIKSMSSVINLAHWYSEPVIMTQEEIAAIKLIDGNYINIKLEKSRVSMVDEVSYVIDNTTSYHKRFVSIKSQSIKIVLPTLGYTLMGERANTSANTVPTKKKFSLANLFFGKSRQEFSIA